MPIVVDTTAILPYHLTMTTMTTTEDTTTIPDWVPHYTHRNAFTDYPSMWADLRPTHIMRGQSLVGPVSAIRVSRNGRDVWAIRGTSGRVFATCSNSVVARKLIRSAQIVEIFAAARGRWEA